MYCQAQDQHSYTYNLDGSSIELLILAEASVLKPLNLIKDLLFDDKIKRRNYIDTKLNL